jgi:hypothetical protein
MSVTEKAYDALIELNRKRYCATQHPPEDDPPPETLDDPELL